MKEGLDEELDENTKKEVEVELENILERNPNEHGFNVDKEEIKEYVKNLLKEKGFEVEVSGEDNFEPNKFHIEYFKKELKEE